MQYRRLGNSGLNVSELGLGTNNFGGRTEDDQSIRVLDQSLDSGVNFIDTADMYNGGRSEEVIGKGLKGKREKALIATKFAIPMGPGPNKGGGSRRYIMEAVEASLERLDTDYIDLYQMHRPDPLTPIEETLRALDDLVHAGKVRYIGCSTFASWQLSDAKWTSRTLNLTAFISEQPHYNVLKRDVETEIVPACGAHGISLIPFFPLENGLLTGKYSRGEAPEPGTKLAQSGAYADSVRQRLFTDRNWDIVEKLDSFAAERGHNLAELAIAWLLANPVVGTVIASASNPEQVVANAKAVDWKLTPDEVARVNEMAPLS